MVIKVGYFGKRPGQLTSCLTALWNVGETVEIDARRIAGLCDVDRKREGCMAASHLTPLSAPQGYGWSSCVRQVGSV